jgi:tRNA-splicing ligase RtcB (3'-phosphate/5'-hydroxy nucleic acid ligase)
MANIQARRGVVKVPRRKRRIGVGELHRQLRGVWFDERRASALRDEAPAVSKDSGRVMRAQAERPKIIRRRRPVLSYKGTGA